MPLPALQRRCTLKRWAAQWYASWSSTQDYVRLAFTGYSKLYAESARIARTIGQLVLWSQGFTLGYEAVDSLIVIDTPDAVKAFTTTSLSIDADVGMGVGKLAGQVTAISNFSCRLFTA